MLRVTQQALDELRDALEERLLDPGEDGIGFRIVPRTDASEMPVDQEDAGAWTGLRGLRTGLSLALDEPGSGDEVFSWGDRPVLILARPVAALLDGFLLDVIEAPDGSRHIAIELPGRLV
jgi:hypothetical protein